MSKQPVSLADEFTRLANLTAYEVENDEIDRTHEKQFDAWTYTNRDLIARALRRDAAIEGYEDQIRDNLRREIAAECNLQREAHIPCDVIAAFREAVR